MKKVLVLLIWLLPLATAEAAFAQDNMQGDLFISLGSGPVRDFSSTAGFGAGFDIPFSRLGQIDIGGHEHSMKLRTDVSYYKWSERFPRDNRSKVSIRRVPVFLAARYLHSFNEQLGFYGEAGLEVSLDETTVDWNGGSSSDSEINAGIALGAGIQYFLIEQIFIGSNFRFHAITDSFVSIGAFLGRRF